MRIFQGDRQTGKTEFLVEWWLAAPEPGKRIIIVPDRNQQTRIIQRISEKMALSGDSTAMSFWLWEKFVLTPSSLSLGRPHRFSEDVEFAYDNIDMLMPIMHPAIATSTEPFEVYPIERAHPWAENLLKS